MNDGNSKCVFLCVCFSTEMYSGLSVGGAVEQEVKKQEQCHLWQTLSPDFVAEKQFNAGMATLEPHCAVCTLFCSYTQVTHPAFLPAVLWQGTRASLVFN